MRKHTINPFNYYSIEPNKRNECRKIIIIYHGWGGRALGYRDLAEELAEEGFNVIVPEIIYHDTHSRWQSLLTKRLYRLISGKRS
ncbi:dienelactone hydrolase family protein [Rossellomorea vietnamensis]|uniref:dienelactone hydrolase family protein n=1 Tax=Rossellomorea vietnamensis TaxID=218284 RepID=UPI001E35C7D2|nr:dienelactone hydrolase family protein [Rossellomorea vietnamensis]MCC5803622.1 dienelactone hydrolase family protein [Rossellomorea vietnamensis]